MKLKVHSFPPSQLKTINIEKAKERMHPSVRQRFEEVFQFLVEPPLPSDSNTELKPSRHCPKTDADQLASDHIITPVSAVELQRRPTRGTIKPFSVVEVEKQRRRIIHWTDDHNRGVADKFQTKVPLDHISSYLSMVESAFGAAIDLRCSFWQIVIPFRARHNYRFADDAGRVFELNRLPMGFAISVELMQILTSVIVGDPQVVQHQFASPAALRVWVDGAYFHGSHQEVSSAIKRAQQTASQLNASLKDDNIVPKKVNEFIGVLWNHEQHVVRLADKTFNKIPRKMTTDLTAQEVE
jgi:hypothetical protein